MADVKIYGVFSDIIETEYNDKERLLKDVGKLTEATKEHGFFLSYDEARDMFDRQAEVGTATKYRGTAGSLYKFRVKYIEVATIDYSEIDFDDLCGSYYGIASGWYFDTIEISENYGEGENG